MYDEWMHIAAQWISDLLTVGGSWKICSYCMYTSPFSLAFLHVMSLNTDGNKSRWKVNSLVRQVLTQWTSGWVNRTEFNFFFNPQEPCVLYIGRVYSYLPDVAFYIFFFSTTISTEYFKHAAHSQFFSSKCHLFHNATFFGSCIIHISHTGCAKI